VPMLFMASYMAHWVQQWHNIKTAIWS
jgi:hypothetical protein